MNDKKQQARIFALRHAASWLSDPDMQFVCDDEDQEIDHLNREAFKKLSKQLTAKAEKLSKDSDYGHTQSNPA